MLYFCIFDKIKLMKNEIIINKSRFNSYSYPLNDIKEVDKILADLRNEHKKATHICYAYVYSREIVREKCSDDGEPNGTAGYPILNVIKKKNLTNILVVVVRYFGGIKLGASGLTRAYTKSASELLNLLN